MNNNIMNIIEKLKNIIKESPSEKDDSKMTNKWSKKLIKVVDARGKDLGITIPATGLISEMIDTAVFIHGIQSFDPQNQRKAQIINTLTIIENELNIHILPIAAKSGTFEELKGDIFFGMKKASNDINADFNAKFESLFGVKPANSVTSEFAKHLKYLNTEINFNAGNPTLPVIILDKKYLVNPDVFDGVLFYKTRKEEAIFSFEYDNRNWKLGLDGTGFQVRGFSNSGHIVKGTLQAITLDELLSNVTSEIMKNIVMEAFNRGDLIGTGDTLKKAPAGRYNVKFYYHNDSKSVGNMLREGTLLLEQWYRHGTFTFGEKLVQQIMNKAILLGKAMTTADELVNFLNRYREAINDGKMPAKDFWSIFEQIQIGHRPMGTHSSDKNAVLMSFAKAAKDHFQLSAGTNKYFDKDGKVSFSFKEHNSIYGIAYVHMDNNLEDGIISVPSRFFDDVGKIISNTQHGELNIALRRDPITFTSVRKVSKMVRRDDNFATIGVPASMMKDLGADSDGDKGHIIIWEKDLFDFEDASTKSINEIILTEDETKVYETVTKFYSKYRKVKDMGHLGKLFEVMESAKVGIVDNALSKIMWAMHNKGRSKNLIIKTIHYLENTVLSNIIDGLKHTVEELPDLDVLSANTKTLEPSATIQMARGKAKIDKEVDFIGDIPKFIKETINKDNHIPKVSQSGLFNIQHMIINQMRDALANVSNKVNNLWTREVQYAARKNVVALLKEIKTTFAANLGTIYGDWGFYEEHRYGTILPKNIKLEEFVRKTNKIKETWAWDNQMKINVMKVPLITELMNIPTTENGKIVMQIMLILSAWVNWPSGPHLSFVYNYVDVRILRAVMDILFGADPETFLNTLVNKEDDNANV